MLQFLNHFHPTVALYSNAFFNGPSSGNDESKEQITKPDLGLYTLSHFLDRFVYKNAKSKPNTRGQSIMQPLGGAHTGSLLVRASGLQSHDVPANTEDWMNKKIEQIKPEDQFFYQYFINKQEKISRSKFDKDLEKKANEDEDEEAEDIDENEVWNALC
ncbi:unnamed protein product [[Candida] boidinii]|uniref:Unnamed protein product n=1 Tax=Candida boidinii TaxID=5477 RepID=A0ACB5UC31_CANBO|nr:unnamed protein product [[Candida] boidinii]